MLHARAQPCPDGRGVLVSGLRTPVQRCAVLEQTKPVDRRRRDRLQLHRGGGRGLAHVVVAPAHRVPSGSSPQLCPPAALMALSCTPSGGVVASRRFEPQHTGVPSDSRPQVCSSPAVMVVSRRPSGGEVSPSTSNPQRRGLPSGSSPQVCAKPAVMVVSRRSSGTLASRRCAPYQVRRRPRQLRHRHPVATTPHPTTCVRPDPPSQRKRQKPGCSPSPCGLGPRLAPQVLVQHRDLDPPQLPQPHMRDRLVDQQLPQRRPRHPHILRSLLIRQPHRRCRAGEPVTQRCCCGRT